MPEGTNMKVSELIESYGYEDILIFENPSYEEAFIGVSEDGRAVYIYERMVESLMKEDGMSEEDAADFISYNTIRSLPYYQDSPIVVYSMEEWKESVNMTKVEVFDTEAKRISKIAAKHDCCEASVVEVLFEILEENGIDIEEAWQKGA